MSCVDTSKSVKAKRAFVAKQTEQAKKTGWVKIRGCGIIPVWVAFRCLYCGEYFNQVTAEEHFGITREEYFKKQNKLGGGPCRAKRDCMDK